MRRERKRTLYVSFIDQIKTQTGYSKDLLRFFLRLCMWNISKRFCTQSFSLLRRLLLQQRHIQALVRLCGTFHGQLWLTANRRKMAAVRQDASQRT